MSDIEIIISELKDKKLKLLQELNVVEQAIKVQTERQKSVNQNK